MFTVSMLTTTRTTRRNATATLFLVLENIFFISNLSIFLTCLFSEVIQERVLQ